MRRHYIVSGILLILPITDFAVAAPVPAQEIPQAGVDVVHIREDAVTTSRKRGDSIDKFVLKENHFKNPKFSLDPRPSSSSPAHALPKPAPLTEPSYESMKVDAPLSTPVFPTWYHPDHADYGLMGTHPSLPKLGPPNPSTEPDSGQRLVVGAPLSTPVFPTWFHPDHADYGLMGAHTSQPKSGPPNPSTEPDSGQRLVVEESPSPAEGSSRQSSA